MDFSKLISLKIHFYFFLSTLLHIKATEKIPTKNFNSEASYRVASNRRAIFFGLGINKKKNQVFCVCLRFS
jgi:hypothetical protein